VIFNVSSRGSRGAIDVEEEEEEEEEGEGTSQSISKGIKSMKLVRSSMSTRFGHDAV